MSVKDVAAAVTVMVALEQMNFLARSKAKQTKSKPFPFASFYLGCYKKVLPTVTHIFPFYNLVKQGPPIFATVACLLVNFRFDQIGKFNQHTHPFQVVSK